MSPPVRTLFVAALLTLPFASAIPASAEEAQTVIVPLPPPQPAPQQPLITPPLSPTARGVPAAKPPPAAPREAQQHHRTSPSVHHAAAARPSRSADSARAASAAEDRRIRRAATIELARRQPAPAGPVASDLKPPRDWPAGRPSLPGRQIASAGAPPGPPPFGYVPDGPPWYGPHAPPYGYPWPRGPAMPW
jgi:hypothetical protein